MAVAHYNKLIEDGENKQLARDNTTNKWSAEKNKGINDK